MRALRVILAVVLAFSLTACDLPAFEPFDWISPEVVSNPPAEPVPGSSVDAGAVPAPLHLGQTAPGPGMPGYVSPVHKKVTKVRGKSGRVKKVVTWVETKVGLPHQAPAAIPVKVEIHKVVAANKPANGGAPFSCTIVRLYAHMGFSEADGDAAAAKMGVTVSASQKREAKKCLVPREALPNISGSMVASSCHGGSRCAAFANAVATPIRTTAPTHSTPPTWTIFGGGSLRMTSLTGPSEVQLRL